MKDLNLSKESKDKDTDKVKVKVKDKVYKEHENIYNQLKWLTGC